MGDSSRKPHRPVSLLLSLALALALVVCAPAASLAGWGYPEISAVSPSRPVVGQVVRIEGSNFGSAKGRVEFNATYPVDAAEVTWSDTVITARVPNNAWGSGIILNTSDGNKAGYIDFYIRPSITAVYPSTAEPTDTVSILGGGFGTGLFGNGVCLYNKSGQVETPYELKGQDYLSWSTDKITFKCPDVADLTYDIYTYIYVSTTTMFRIESGRARFTVEEIELSITNLSPSTFPPGSIITLDGNGFRNVRGLNDYVEFRNEATGEVTRATSYPSWGPTKARVRVPQISTGGITITMKLEEPGGDYADSNVAGTSDNNPVPPEDIVNSTSRVWGHDSVGVKIPATDWYLPEGSTAGGDETWVLVQNPNPQPTDVSLTYITASKTKNVTDSVGANSRKSFKASDAFSNTAGVSVRVKAGAPIVAEKAVYGSHRSWGHESVGVSGPATEWYLAEGCTAAGFETRISVMNPNSAPAKVKLTYMAPAGEVKGPSETIPAQSRRSYNVADMVPNSWEVSTKVMSDRPVAAERAMFGNNGAWAHDSVGVTAPRNTWYLAEGCTAAGFETWVLVQNPGDTPAGVSLTYMTPSGAVAGPSETIPPRSRRTFEVAKTVPDTWEVSTRVSSDRAIVAERAMYGNNRTWAHESVGVSAPVNTWYLGEGCTGAGFETWVLVQNPNDSPAGVTITYMTPAGAVRGPSETLPRNSRKTFNPAETVNSCYDISTMVTSDSNIVVERAMYGDMR